MRRCMLCGKEYEDVEVRGGVCRSCSEGVRREAAGGKVREKRASDRALRQSGQPPERRPEPCTGDGSQPPVKRRSGETSEEHRDSERERRSRE